MEIFKEIPPRWEDRTEDDWLAYANAVKRKVYDQRFEFPREWPYYLGWNAQHSNAPGHDLLPARRRQHAPVHQRAADPALGAEGHGAAVHGRLAPVPAQGRRRLGRVGRVEGRRSSTRSPTSRSAASSACAAAWSRRTRRRRIGSLGTVRTDHEAYFLMQNLMLLGEALRLGGWVHGAPMIPHVMRRDPAKGYLGLGFREHSTKPATSRFKRWPPVPASQPNFVGHRRRAGGPVPAVRHRHGRGRRPGHRGEVRAGRRLRRPARSSGRPTRTRPAPRATCATPRTTRPRRSSTRRRSAATSSRPTGASRRTPTPSTSRAPGCSSPTWRSSTTSASATPSTRAGRPRAGRSGGAVDEHAGPDEHRAQRGGDAGEAARQPSSAG